MHAPCADRIGSCMHEPSHRLHVSIHLTICTCTYARPSRRVCVRVSEHAGRPAPCVLSPRARRWAAREAIEGEEGAFFCCLHLHAWKPKGGLPERTYVIERSVHAAATRCVRGGIGRRILSALEEASHACTFVSERPALRIEQAKSELLEYSM